MVSGQSAFSASVSVPISLLLRVNVSLCLCVSPSNGPCLPGSVGASPPPHRPCLSVSASPPVSLCLPLFSVPASPSDSVLRLCVCLSSATSGSTFRPCQETCGSGRCLTSEQQPRAHRGPCPHPRGLQSPDWDEAAKGKGREKGSRLPRVTQLGGGEARECRGAQTGCRRARTGWRGQLCTESLGPGQRLPHNPPGPFSAGPFPLKLVLAWGLCTSHSLRLECPSPRSPYNGMSLPTPPPGSPP